MNVVMPKTKDSIMFRMIVPVNIMTVILLIGKLFGWFPITWLQSLTPSLALSVLMGLMTQYGLWMFHQEEKVFDKKDMF